MIGQVGPKGVVLDTCAVIWLANGDRLRPEAFKAIMEAALQEGVFVSAISAWEIGLLDRRGAAGGISFLPDPKTWFGRMMAGPSIRTAPFTPDIAIDASRLPEPLHGDPADRLLIATARQLGYPLVTRDRKIAAYAALGHVGVVAC
jgi:PIN domain nuclease of toxin-antitoxin system